MTTRNMIPIPNTQQVLTKAFPVMAVICWAIVMYLFEKDKSCLQESLTSSMDFLYKESDSWNSWKEFVPFAESLFPTPTS
jgi:peroxisomal membrane protein 4